MSGMHTLALELEKLAAGYRNARILDDLSLRVEQGDIVGVIGPNGAGKTTLLRCITGLCRSISGQIHLFGNSLKSISAAKRSRLVAVVPQEVNTPMAFTVREMVMIGRTASLSPWKSPTKEDFLVVERSMVYTDVAEMADRVFNEMSGGEKQRAMVAMALAQEPRLILLDEATSHLDMNHRLEIMQMVERLNQEQGVTVLMVSHDLNMAAEFCSRLLLMNRGKIVADGAPRDVLKEEVLSDTYQCEVKIQHDLVDGAITVIPARRLAPQKARREKGK